MSRATTGITVATALLVSLGCLTACRTDSPSAATSPSASAAGPVSPAPRSPAPQSPTAQASPADSAPPMDTPSASKPTPVLSATAPGGRRTGAGGLPASVWMAADGIPMASLYHWGAPAAAAQAVHNPRFEFEQLCASTRDPSNDLADWKGPSAQAHLAGPTQNYADWQVQQTVIHFPGTSSTGAQLAAGLYQGLQDELNACAQTVRGARVRVTANGGDGGNEHLAAVVTVPESGGSSYTLHQYLSLTGRAVVELALWSDQPVHAWSAPSDAAVLKALESPVCPALRDC